MFWLIYSFLVAAHCLSPIDARLPRILRSVPCCPGLPDRAGDCHVAVWCSLTQGQLVNCCCFASLRTALPRQGLLCLSGDCFTSPGVALPCQGLLCLSEDCFALPGIVLPSQRLVPDCCLLVEWLRCSLSETGAKPHFCSVHVYGCGCECERTV